MTSPVLIVDDEEDKELSEKEEGKEFETLDPSDDLTTSVFLTKIDEIEGCLEAWDDIGAVAVAIGSKMVKREAVIIRKLCHRMKEREKKRKHDANHDDRCAHVDDLAGRISLIAKAERMQRMAGLLYNLELIHRRLRREIETVAKGEDVVE
jgi:hypothetical protein